ncbi:hypothetical protein [Caldalkalibacillus mannanilyticus]|uniref:hypothetical protein n=1 Tax=Caldalkalibacillus mannanilyticus TaxID=1418 RepID=UPI0004684414|nr:hypothetical protein [Caldalkalibacillus mannanilyticus]
MLQTKTWYKNKTWFFLHGKVIYIRKWNKTYKISNKAFVDLMEYVFPVIKEQAVTNEDFEKYCEDNKYKQFEVIKEKVQSILTNQYIVDEEALKTPSPQLIILDDERLEKKWMFKRYTNVIVSKYQIHQEKAVGSKGPIILLIKSIEKVQEQVEHLFECYRGLEKLSIVFPFQQEVILYQGTLEGLMNLVKFLTCFETNEDIHPPHLDAALYKAISLLHDSKNQDEKVFRIDLSTSQIFTEMIYLLDPCEYRSDKTNLEDITFEPEKAHHIVIFQLNKLVKSLPYLIEKLEYGKLQQVPYKVASCSFRVNGQKNRIYVSGESPQEVYKDAFRQGLTKVLQMSDENKKEIGQFTNWVVAEKLEQIYTEGIIPLVFQYVREHSPEKAKSWCIHLMKLEIISLFV